MFRAFRVIPGEVHDIGEKYVRLVMEEATPERAVASVRFLSERVTRWDGMSAAIYLATLTEPSILMGRFQKPDSALSSIAFDSVKVVRRNTGGRSMYLPKGSIYFGLVIPRYDESLAAGAPLRRAYKDLVSYFLSSLNEFIAARSDELGFSEDVTRQDDHILWRGTTVGGIAFDFTADRTAVLEAWLLYGVEPFMPEEYNNYPRPVATEYFPNESSRGIFSRAVSLFTESLDEFPKEVLARMDFADTMQRSEWNMLESAVVERYEESALVSADSEKDDRLVFSSPIEDRIGYVLAGIRLDPKGTSIQTVRLYGDFIADSPGIEELERRLATHPVDRRLIALAIDEVLGTYSHIILGLRRLGTILDAVLSAAGRLSDR